MNIRFYSGILDFHALSGIVLIKLKKLTAITLTFLFVLSAVSPALATEALPDVVIDSTAIQESVIEPNQEPVIEADVLPTESPIDIGDENITNEVPFPIKDEAPSEAESFQADEPHAIPVISPSTIKHQLAETDAMSGALTYSYPIVVPPGRQGLQPDLNLTYNNQEIQNDNIIGAGWKINIPYIERINRNGSEKLYTENYFTSSLSGELVNTSGSTYKSKVDNGEFLDYSFSSNVWTVKDKKGVVYKFGTNVAERQDNPSDSTKVYKWMLQEIRDLNGNYVNYEYYKDSGQIYPNKIKYTGNGSTDGIFEIEFFREARPDFYTSYKTAFAVTTNYRVIEIQMKTIGLLTRKYTIQYIIGDNSRRSLINTITETGLDEITQALVALPATDFDYQTSQDDIVLDTNYSIPIWLSEGNKDVGVRIIDVNGDGLMDLLRLQKRCCGLSHHINVYINNGTNGWTDDTSNWTIPSNFFFTGDGTGNEGGEISDINGDNLPDLLLSISSTNTKKVFINSGSGWVEDASWVIPIHFNAGNPNEDSSVRLFDANGDDLMDFILVKKGFSQDTREIYLNNGSGWVQNTSWTFPTNYYFGNYGGQNEGGKYGDVNGDGLVDLLQYYPTPLRNEVFLNTGAGWELNTSWTMPVYLSNGSEDVGVRMVDLNGDGLTDMLRLNKRYGDGPHWRNVYINNGVSGWDEDVNWTLPQDVFFANYSGNDEGGRISDINGDTLSGILLQPINTLTNKVYTHQGKRADLITRLTYTHGGRTDVVYKPTPAYIDGSTKLNPNLPMALDTVEQISHHDGLGVVSTYNYQYEGGKYYFAEPYDRKFAGFAKVTKTDSVGNKTTTYFHQGDATNSIQGEYSDHSSKIGKPYRAEALDSSGNKFNVTINKWENYDLGNGRNFVKQTQNINLTYDGDASHKNKAATFSFDNSNGNLIQKIEWGEVAGVDNGTFTDIGTDKFTTNISYANNISLNILGLPSQETVTDQSGGKIKELRFYYDTLALGSVNKGNLTKKEDWKTGTTYINSQKTYDSYGLVITDTDPRGKMTSYVYDSYNLYPITVTQPHNLVTQYTYDYSSGQVSQTTDPNGLVFQTVYDGLDRPVVEKHPNLAAPASLLAKASYSYTPQAVGTKVVKSVYLDISSAVSSYTYTDGFDRPIQTRTQMEDANTFAVSDTIYNDVGQIAKQSLPYASLGTGKTAATTDSSLLTTYTYDSIMRVISTQNAVGTATNSYDDWKTSITDARGKVKHFYKDAYDRLVRVEESNSGNTYSTNYEYNGLGNLTKITDALNNVRNFTYNGLGQRLTAQDLHAPADATFGTWTYAYDNNGNLTSSLDPKGQTVNYTYDDLNRPLTEDFTGQAGTEITYTYDTCTYGKTRLCGVVNAGANASYLYNPLGGIARETKTISSVNYLTDFIYDQQGNVLNITNPDLSQVKYTYNAAGQMETVQRKESSGSSFINVATDFDYGPHGGLVYQANTNGTTTSNTYDATKLYRLQRKLTTNGSGLKLQDINYTYDAVGNITKLVDASQTSAAKTVDYTYDDLNRLLTATATGVAAGQTTYTHAYTYDAVGNILTRAETIGTNPAIFYTYSYSSAGYTNPHAVTSISDGTTITNFTYDNNGNLTSEGSRTFTWNYHNQLMQASMPGSAPTTVTVNFYPSTGDGSIYYNASTNWDSTHDAVTGSAANYTATTFKVNSGKIITSTNKKVGSANIVTMAAVPGGGSGSAKFSIERAFIPFDTSSLPDNAVITSAKLKVFVDSKLNNDNDGADWVTIVQGAEPSITTLTTADYDLAGSINFPVEGIDTTERKDITNVVTGQYLELNLNATGRGWISATGSTKLALREGHDVLDSAFTGSSGQYNQLAIRSGEYSGTSSDPVLEVTYSLPPSPVTSTYTYDASGQRVKVIAGGVTTVYPTKSFNTDGIKKIKHIFAGDIMTATIETSGALTTPHYVSTDHLTGSNVVTNSSGAQEELMDYYPFGGIRLDEKAGTFSEQRKFTGYEYDTDTGLNYANARYQNPTQGRFISQDPVFWSISEELLADPQQLNSYSYARNNPMVGIDPTGLLTVIIPGTNYNSNTWSENGSASSFISEVGKTFNETPVVINDQDEWSGENTVEARWDAAYNINGLIRNHTFADGEKLNIIGHSHGGNIGAIVSQITDRKIDNLITLGTPVRDDIQPNNNMIDRHINAYSNFDSAQQFGGEKTYVSEILGQASFGWIGGLIGRFLARGPMPSFADRQFSGAKNVNVTTSSIGTPLGVHSNLWQNKSVWARLNSFIK